MRKTHYLRKIPPVFTDLRRRRLDTTTTTTTTIRATTTTAATTPAMRGISFNVDRLDVSFPTNNDNTTPSNSQVRMGQSVMDHQTFKINSTYRQC